MNIAQRLSQLSLNMQKHNWNYRFCEDGNEWRRHQQMSDYIVRESYELRQTGLIKEVDELWIKYKK